jgi:hypothetical protein
MPMHDLLRVVLATTLCAVVTPPPHAPRHENAQQPAKTPVDAAKASLDVSGVGLTSTRFDAGSLRNMPRVSLKIRDKDGVESTYEGVRVSEILIAAGMKFGQSLRGPRLVDYLIAESADGYRVLFALPEFDPDFSDRTIIVADSCDAKPLTGRDSPLKIIVSDERKHARWVRNVTKFTIQSASDVVKDPSPQE